MAGLLDVLAAFKGGRPALPKLPERPPAWDPDIPVNGSPILANLVRIMQYREPRLSRLVTKVQSAPTPALIEDLNRSGFNMNDFDRTDIAGAYGIRDRDIFIRPGNSLKRQPTTRKADEANDPPSIQQILFHEFAHAKGANEGDAQMLHRGMDPTLHSLMYNRIVKRLYPKGIR